jgi:uncharacterized protein YfkK (UPF0435 family)
MARDPLIPPVVSAAAPSTRVEGVANRRDSNNAITGLATKVEVEETRNEFNQKIDYCLKTLAQMNQSVFDAGKHSSSANSDVKELQQLVASLEKNVRVSVAGIFIC